MSETTQRGHLPMFKVGSNWRMTQSALDGWMQSSTMGEHANGK